MHKRFSFATGRRDKSPKKQGINLHIKEFRANERATMKRIARVETEEALGTTSLSERDKQARIEELEAEAAGMRKALETIFAKHNPRNRKDHEHYPPTTALCLEALNGTAGAKLLEEIKAPKALLWHDAALKKPKDNEEVIVYIPSEDCIDMASYDSDSDTWMDRCDGEMVVSHWMPKPQKPKGAEE